MSYEEEYKPAPLINKQLALRFVLEAKAAHIKWRAYALGLVEGIDCPSECVPLQSTECEFGKWYYGPGKKMLGDTVFYNCLEPPHEVLHAIYGKIYSLAREGKIDEARACLISLREISNILLDALAFLEKEIDSMPPHR